MEYGKRDEDMIMKGTPTPIVVNFSGRINEQICLLWDTGEKKAEVKKSNEHIREPTLELHPTAVELLELSLGQRGWRTPQFISPPP